MLKKTNKVRQRVEVFLSASKQACDTKLKSHTQMTHTIKVPASRAQFANVIC
ncbi:hypothetical protein [Fangia hongkongensis]|uniref:hypothetical protein n=1 Tax=Fangia hongkongensis TaxID=270495 RepID=UPI00035F6080|nr:hypothetical protein [Fangia hongkongensis]MBK2125768.1 hypothetical protein [Fangia hongkongensis]